MTEDKKKQKTELLNMFLKEIAVDENELRALKFKKQELLKGMLANPITNSLAVYAIDFRILTVEERLDAYGIVVKYIVESMAEEAL